MKLLLLLKVGVVLGDTLECQLLHEINELRGLDVLGLELLNLHRISGREEHDLLVLRHNLNDLSNDTLEID